MKRKFTTSLLLISLALISCKKVKSVVPEPIVKSLNGTWIEGSWTFVYANGDSIISTGNWMFTDSIVDDAAGKTWYHYSSNLDSLLKLTTNNVNNIANIRGEYVGDGYCCGVLEVNVQGMSYLNDDTISVDGKNYVINEHQPQGESLDEEYKYYVELSIVTPYLGCKSYLSLFKRIND